MEEFSYTVLQKVFISTKGVVTMDIVIKSIKAESERDAISKFRKLTSETKRDIQYQLDIECYKVDIEDLLKAYKTKEVV